MYTGGGLWAPINIGAVVVLGIAIAYGTMTGKRRGIAGLEAVRDDATKRLYTGRTITRVSEDPPAMISTQTLAARFFDSDG